MVSVPWPAPLPSFRQGLNPIEAAPPAGLSGLLGGFNDWRGANRNLLVGIGADLLSGQWGSHTPQGSALDQQQQEKLKAEAKAAEQQNATLAYFAKKYPDLAAAVQAGMPIGQAWQTAMDREKPGAATDPTSTVEGRTALAQQYGLNGDEAKMFVLTGKLPGGNDTARYGNAPIYARNPQTGEYIAIQPGSDGSINNLSDQLPPGFQIDPGALNSDKAAGTAFGTAQGGLQFNLPAAKQNVDTELANIDAILADTQGLEETFGKVAGVWPQQWAPTIPGTPKANMQERIKQVVGQNFLQAFASLKGAGAITETEGAKAQEAMARLGQAQSQESFTQALADLKAVLKLGYDRMASQASAGPYQSGGYQPPALGSQNGFTTSTGVTWSVGP